MLFCAKPFNQRPVLSDLKSLDIGGKFLGSDGNVPAELMPDYLHPSERGCRVWAMVPVLAEMMR